MQQWSDGGGPRWFKLAEVHAAAAAGGGTDGGGNDCCGSSAVECRCGQWRMWRCWRVFSRLCASCCGRGELTGWLDQRVASRHRWCGRPSLSQLVASAGVGVWDEGDIGSLDKMAPQARSWRSGCCHRRRQCALGITVIIGRHGYF